MGASQVKGVDFSEEMLRGASQNCKDCNNIKFIHGDAYDTKLPDGEYDIILERALIHHLVDYSRSECTRNEWISIA
ncbi:hypothetical protein PCCS19_00620 [Paenibacillus sp. CCS19]|nr:hypothetical protein PCCS19_00620 [Paenibacillus cellulosilyticus]